MTGFKQIQYRYLVLDLGGSFWHSFVLLDTSPSNMAAGCLFQPELVLIMASVVVQSDNKSVMCEEHFIFKFSDFTSFDSAI